MLILGSNFLALSEGFPDKITSLHPQPSETIDKCELREYRRSKAVCRATLCFGVMRTKASAHCGDRDGMLLVAIAANSNFDPNRMNPVT
mmetsp:Transcript_5241/g.9212  ORF Transcript_5241/g.9212 Transcript_5241/m.9212 type:complete len:89 (-) Transcript_5241:227-493(-)